MAAILKMPDNVSVHQGVLITILADYSFDTGRVTANQKQRPEQSCGEVVQPCGRLETFDSAVGLVEAPPIWV